MRSVFSTRGTEADGAVAHLLGLFKSTRSDVAPRNVSGFSWLNHATSLQLSQIHKGPLQNAIMEWWTLSPRAPR